MIKTRIQIAHAIHSYCILLKQRGNLIREHSPQIQTTSPQKTANFQNRQQISSTQRHQINPIQPIKKNRAYKSSVANSSKGATHAEAGRKHGRRLVELRGTRVQRRCHRRATDGGSGESGVGRHQEDLVEEVGGVALRRVRRHAGNCVDCVHNLGIRFSRCEELESGNWKWRQCRMAII